MRKIQGKKPNRLLRQAREQQGWSQEKLAQELEISVQTVSRWELGTAFPYPRFREKLCLLFNKSTEELGLYPGKASVVEWGSLTQRQDFVKTIVGEENQDISDANEIARQALFPESSAMLPVSISDPMLSLPRDLVGRDGLIQRLKQRLCADRNMGVTALHGLPGVGKTVLAVALAHDCQIRAHFYDGEGISQLRSPPTRELKRVWESG